MAARSPRFKTALQILEREMETSRVSLRVCDCMYLCVLVEHVCVLCRINNLDGSAAREDTVQTWLKLLAAASEGEVNMRSVRMFWRERSHHAGGAEDLVFAAHL